MDILIRIGAACIWIDLCTRVDVGPRVGVDHLHRHTSGHTGVETAGTGGRDREDVLAGYGRDGEPSHVVGGFRLPEAAGIVQRTVEDDHRIRVTLGINASVLANVSLRVLVDQDHADTHPRAAAIQADAQRACNHIDICCIGRGHQNVAACIHHCVVCDVGVRMVVQDDHGHRAGAREISITGHRRGDRKDVLSGVGAHLDVLPRIHQRFRADVSLRRVADHGRVRAG